VPSLTRGWVGRLQLLLALTSAVILGSESPGTHDHILLAQVRDFPNLEGQVPIFISPRNRVAQLYPQALGSLFVASLIILNEHTSQSYATTDGQSASLSWCQAPIWDLRPYFFSDSCGVEDVRRPRWREDGSLFYNVHVQCIIYILHVTTRIWPYIADCARYIASGRTPQKIQFPAFIYSCVFTMPLPSNEYISF
jgi:hypothetical protein